MADLDKNISIWKGPVFMGSLSFFGLLMALLAGNWFDYISVMLLGVPAVYSMFKSLGINSD